jgi:hypothetical protein
MASHATLVLRKDPETGKYTLDIGYEGDAGALPMEHEEEHRRLAVGVAGPEGVAAAVRVSRQRGGGGSDEDDGGQKIGQEG